MRKKLPINRIQGVEFWDHPRVCGKNVTEEVGEIRDVGSPPRVREKRCIQCTLDTSLRITPACAGKTPTLKVRSSTNWDHPRVCGKNTFWTNPFVDISGSPPRVREKHTMTCEKRLPPGITPACAGKTKSSLLNLVVVQDHPRVCGKNTKRSQ